MKYDWDRVDVYCLHWPTVLYMLNRHGEWKLGARVAEFELTIMGTSDYNRWCYEVRREGDHLTVVAVNSRTGESVPIHTD